MTLETKKRWELFPHHGWNRIYFATNPPPVPNIAGGDINVLNVSTRDSTRLPGYRSIIKNGDCATTPLTAEFRNTIRVRPVSIAAKQQEEAWRGNTVREEFFTTSGGVPYTNVTHYATDALSADNAALIRARAAVKSQQQQMSGFTFLGELKESIQMIRRPAQSIVKSLDRYFTTLSKRKRGIRRGNARLKQKTLVDIASGTWLEISFGWKPLLADVRDAAETLARWSTEKDRHTNVRGYGKSESFLEIPAVRIPVSGGQILLERKTTWKSERIVVYRVRVKSDDTGPPLGSLERLSDLCGFRAEDFIPSVYQLIPMSFLVDYFLNVGDVLEAACTSTSSVKWVNRSEVVRTIETVRATPLQSLQPFYYSVEFRVEPDGPAETVRSLSTITRSSSSTLGLPSLQFSLPGSDSTKWKNVAALLASKGSSLLRF